MRSPSAKDITSERGARAFFERWKDSLKWQRLAPYRKFTELVESDWDGIASYCHPENKVSPGLVEGVNNKIRVLQRRAYGQWHLLKHSASSRVHEFVDEPRCAVPLAKGMIWAFACVPVARGARAVARP